MPVQAAHTFQDSCCCGSTSHSMRADKQAGSFQQHAGPPATTSSLPLSPLQHIGHCRVQPGILAVAASSLATTCLWAGPIAEALRVAAKAPHLSLCCKAWVEAKGLN